tara:strand:+ start:187 stop:615 length:429 start_codon:yes stop_codon:yes gene_type:complete
MEQYKYGPLVYNTTDSDDDTGNYYWPGIAPVGYDDIGIPIDNIGYQCLDVVQCPLHPGYEVKDEDTEHNEALGCKIPTLNSFNGWFEDAFIKAEPRDLAFFIIRWLNFQDDVHPATSALYSKYAQLDIDDIINAIWPSLKAS